MYPPVSRANDGRGGYYYYYYYYYCCYYYYFCSHYYCYYYHYRYYCMSQHVSDGPQLFSRGWEDLVQGED